ncbi:MAG: trimethylamine methyltransferase family protein, partial [Aristaeellaceae bacterium]
LAYAGRIERIKVTSMPALGCNAPLDIESALCLGLAESMGGAVVMERLTGLPCDFLVQLHPFDFWAVNFVYGTPETQLLSEAAVDFNAALKGVPVSIRRANIHVMAKLPGVQAAAEKSAMITAGVRNGAVRFSGLGTLSLDEIYSPLQLVLDMEMLEQAGRLRDGWPCEEPRDAEEMLERIREGMDAGYMSSDLTLDCLADCVWHSRLFTRYTLAEYQRRDEKEALEKAADLVARHEDCGPLYRPTRDMLREMKRICAAAWKQATGEAWCPPQLDMQEGR